MRFSLILISLLFATTSFAQITWEYSSTPDQISVQSIQTFGDTTFICSYSGLRKTTDGGDHWSIVPVPTNVTPQSILILANGEYILNPGMFGVCYRSSNQGASWTQITNWPVQTAIVYNRRSNILLSAGIVQIGRSSDGGLSWTYYASPTNEIVSLFAGQDSLIFGVFEDWAGFRSLHYTVNGTNWTQAAAMDLSYYVYSANSRGELFRRDNSRISRSLDSGRTWTLLPTNFGGNNIDQIALGSNGLMAVTVGMPFRTFVSTNSGDSWVRLADTDSLNSRVMSFGANNSLLIGSYGTLRRFTLPNLAPIRLQVGASEVTPAHFHRTMDGRIYYLTNYNVLVVSQNNGDTWEIAGDTLLYISPLRSDAASNLYIPYRSSTVYIQARRSTDHGRRWTTISIPTTANATSDQSFCVLPNGTLLISRATSSQYLLLRSTNGGATWAETPCSHNPRAMTVHTSGALLGLHGDAFVYSTNDGTTWTTPANLNIPPDITGGSLQVGSDGVIYLQSDLRSLHKSTDMGASWQTIYPGRGGIWINPRWVLTSHVAPNGTLVLFDTDTTRGVMVSTNGGTTWQRANNNLPTTEINCFGSTNDGRLLAGVPIRGVARSNVITATHEPRFENVPTSLTLLPAFPNPFNHTTRIHYRVASAATVKLTVYTTDGREVETLFNRWHTAGEHAFEWDAQGVASGTYWMHLQADAESATQPVTLVK